MIAREWAERARKAQEAVSALGAGPQARQDREHGMTETAAPRTTRDGRPCPPWCATDHTGEFAAVCVGGCGGTGNIWTRAVRMPDGNAMVSLNASLPDGDDDWPSQRLDPRAAEHMAVIIGLLAGATPEEHRELAAAIRENAALIAEDSHG